MTLEEIKAEIKRDLNLAIMRKHHLLISSLPRILKMLDQLEPSWHPYPQEKPPVDGYYLVTTTKMIVTIYFLRDSEWLYVSDVIAWAELPKPYKKEEKT